MTVTLAATIVQSINVPPAVRIIVASTVLSPEDMTATRTHTDGTVHRVLLETGARVIGGSAVITDYCLPYNQTVTYTVTVGAASATVTKKVVCKYTYLIHPAEPALSVRVKGVRAVSDRGRASRAAEFQPMDADPLSGRNLPIFQSNGHRAGLEGTFVARVEERDMPKVDALVDDDSILLINTPGVAGWDVRWLWAKMDVTLGNPVGRLGVHDRSVSLAYKQAADPDVDQTPVWTNDAAVAYWISQGVTTSNQIKLKYATALDAKIDNRL